MPYVVELLQYVSRREPPSGCDVQFFRIIYTRPDLPGCASRKVFLIYPKRASSRTPAVPVPPRTQWIICTYSWSLFYTALLHVIPNLKGAAHFEVPKCFDHVSAGQLTSAGLFETEPSEGHHFRRWRDSENFWLYHIWEQLQGQKNDTYLLIPGS